ncbi:polyamine oxidase-like protein [Dothidotthia symphoricarpi CBS 119687]|uniref:Amine oxidase n=1 Tax=Dothidotthia symphoricarpi CBS 119687 TaxID=1392245 RepID=A0A6A5ZXY2_9PLEO|nr:polyamine oxidase-like protein [Dothidotthia symphoricarpi CBS 119687]KAF2124440.1 polyamine oxidase-like protein [Dothidotthia symphoricarpi CBS 119687]
MFSKDVLLLIAGVWPAFGLAAPTLHARDGYNSTCRKTTVAILGGGVAGVTAAHALHNQSVTDFLIVEYNSGIGGRMRNTKFGSDPNGNPYLVELGANWVSGTGTPDGPENPVWSFAKQANLTAPFSDTRSIATYNETGAVNYTYLIDEFEDAWAKFEQNAGTILTENLQDMSAKAGFFEAGWKAKQNAMRKAVEWWMWDWDAAQTPEESSLVFGITAYNLTYYQFAEENYFSVDQRGFNTWLKTQASSFLEANDTRLMFNTVVTDINYSETGVTVTNEDGSCIEADYAICTFSLGVLQNDVVTFTPELPSWKQTSLATFSMGTYTKIFLQFNETFWPTDSQFFLYAHPTTRGYYPVWQSLSIDGFLPGSNILFVTVVDEQSYRIEAQDDETTKAEVMAVLRQMLPDTDVPDPIDFMYPRWTLNPWTFGSYSNWPVGTTLEMHQNLRANVDRLYFAGEATSAEYFGFLHGAWFEGQEAGKRIAGMVTKDCENQDGGCGEYVNYEVLHGTTEREEYNATNGMGADPMFYADSGEEEA